MTSGFGPAEFAARIDVSRETLVRLQAYVRLLEEWNTRHNLVSKTGLEDVWQRHVLDSAQLVRFIPPNAKSLVDLGSGAGFPSLILASLLQNQLATVVLFESTAKKCRFLAKAAEVLGVRAEIRNSRIEDAPRQSFNCVTARACAPLTRLLNYAQAFQGVNTTNLFLKGQNLAEELTEARKSWKITAQTHPSLSDPSGAILEVRHFERLRQSNTSKHRPGESGVR